MARRRSGLRLGLREARLITKELRLLGVPPKVIAYIWLTIGAVVFLLFVVIVIYALSK
jgi:hypothetical protein